MHRINKFGVFKSRHVWCILILITFIYVLDLVAKLCGKITITLKTRKQLKMYFLCFYSCQIILQSCNCFTLHGLAKGTNLNLHIIFRKTVCHFAQINLTLIQKLFHMYNNRKYYYSIEYVLTSLGITLRNIWKVLCTCYFFCPLKFGWNKKGIKYKFFLL